MKSLSLLLAFTLWAPLQASATTENSLKPFETDGCTLFIDGPPHRPNLWRHCCVEHDLRYWFGGSYEDRDKIDYRLKTCVDKVAGPVWAEIIYRGVRMGHSSPVKNKYQWSWGWSTPREHKPIGPIEAIYVISELKKLPMDQDVINHFILNNFPIITNALL